MGKCSCGLSMLNTINVYAVGSVALGNRLSMLNTINVYAVGLRLACLMRLKNLESRIFVLICGNGNTNRQCLSFWGRIPHSVLTSSSVVEWPGKNRLSSDILVTSLKACSIIYRALCH